MELMKCPFCNSDVLIRTTKESFDFLVREHGESAIRIDCKNFECGCQFWTFPDQHHTKDYDVAVDVATKRWNHRAEVKTSESL